MGFGGLSLQDLVMRKVQQLSDPGRHELVKAEDLLFWWLFCIYLLIFYYPLDIVCEAVHSKIFCNVQLSLQPLLWLHGGPCKSQSLDTSPRSSHWFLRALTTLQPFHFALRCANYIARALRDDGLEAISSVKVPKTHSSIKLQTGSSEPSFQLGFILGPVLDLLSPVLGKVLLSLFKENPHSWYLITLDIWSSSSSLACDV